MIRRKQKWYLVCNYISEELGVPEIRICVVISVVDGRLGIKRRVLPYEVLIAWIAMQVGCLVEWIEDRREHLFSSIDRHSAFIAVWRVRGRCFNKND